jgi:arylsulfatase A-like enzyme
MPRRRASSRFPGRSDVPWLVLAVAGAGVLGWGFWGNGAEAPPPAEDLRAASEDPSSPTPVARVPATAGTLPVSPGTVSLDGTAPEAKVAPDRAALCPGCDIVVITVCSLRRDHVGVYGEHPGLTPALDSLAADGVRFTRAYAASNFTLASLAAVLTGRFGSHTGVTGWDKGLTADVPTLPEVLGIYGYRTGAFTVDAPSGFRPDYGLHRGFQRMEIIPPPRDTPDGRFLQGDPTPQGATAGPLVGWLGSQDTSRPIFAMMHTRTAHYPFVLAPPADGEDPTGIRTLLWEAGRAAPTGAKGDQAMPGMAGGTAQKGVVSIAGPDPLQVQVRKGGAPAVAAWRQAYAEAVTRMDLDVKRVLDAIDARGRKDRTIVLVVGDHGESLDDHGELLHGDAYWDSVVNVPLLLRVPGLTGRARVVDALVSQTDILPTLLDLVGAVPPAGIDGVSMAPLLTGAKARVRETTFVEGGVARQHSDVPRGAVVTAEWTLLRQDRGCADAPGRDAPRRPGEPATCLYARSTDASQAANVARSHPDVVTDLLGRWDAFRAANASAAAALTLDPAFVKSLQQNGYAFTPGPAVPAAAGTRARRPSGGGGSAK